MRLHFILNSSETPPNKLADVEIHFDDGLLGNLKLVGASVWKAKKDGEINVLVPARSYASAQGIRYYELLRPSDGDDRKAVEAFKQTIKDEYNKIVTPATDTVN
jgi:hypothetical protein